ncbi:MAG TPA: glycosyltransferase family 4 protein [Thermodesulfobacteriota bacterium]|nr:glycosyltransferase family 4 protein [Thermodesulfobacteriota bacterium]
MKIAFCLFKYFPFGGMQRDFIRVADLCHQRGHTVEAFVLHWEGIIPPWLKVRVFANSRLTNHHRCRTFVRRITPVIQQGGYDLVMGFDKMPGLDVYFAADPCFRVRERERHSWLYRLTPRYRHFAAFEKAVFDRQARTEILLLAEQKRARFISVYQTAPERFHILPPGISREFMYTEEAEGLGKPFFLSNGIDPQRTFLLFVGSRFVTKGLDRALTSVASLPLALRKTVDLHVVGSDAAGPFIRMAKQLGIAGQVRFWGGRDDVRRFYLAADLLIHPAYTEAAGMVLLEALVSGLPVLTTDRCGYAHYITEAQAGIVLSSPYRQEAMNQALDYMISAPERTRWIHNGRVYGRQHNLYDLHKECVNMIERFGQERCAKEIT